MPAGTRATPAPCFHARLTARYALFWAGSTSSVGPLPVVRPGNGTMAAAAGLESKPMPGTLSNGAASAGSATLYAVTFPFGATGDPSGASFARTSASSGLDASATWTPIWSGSVQPAASYGLIGGPPGYWRRSGYSRVSSTSRAMAANSWSVGTTQVPAG